MKISLLLDSYQSSTTQKSISEVSHTNISSSSTKTPLPRVLPMSKHKQSESGRGGSTMRNAAQPPRSNPFESLSEKLPKLRKDAPHFRKGHAVGEVNFPPHVVNDPDVIQQLIQSRIYPENGKISEFIDHVPYSSEKRAFHEIGRSAFEVFQYEFVVPGEQKQGEEAKKYHVMWDYNIGLVRVTAFFKACKYPKTTPARTLGVNPGLRDITYSITGGALRAQGYWMPFEAAKEVAATFCWKIRYALVPIFGPHFPDMCIQPNTKGYESFMVNLKTIQKCQVEAESWREKAQNSSRASSVISKQYLSNLSLAPKNSKHPRHSSTASSEASQATRSKSASAMLQDLDCIQPNNDIVLHHDLIKDSENHQNTTKPISQNFQDMNVKMVTKTKPIALTSSVQSFRGPETVLPTIGVTQFKSFARPLFNTETQSPDNSYLPDDHVRSRSPYTPFSSSSTTTPSFVCTPASSTTRIQEIPSPFTHVTCCGHLICHTTCKLANHASQQNRSKSYTPPQYHHSQSGPKVYRVSEFGVGKEAVEAARTLQVLSGTPTNQNVETTNLASDLQRRQLPIPERPQGIKPYEQLSSESIISLSPIISPRLAPMAPAHLHQQKASVSSIWLSISPFQRQQITLPSIDQLLSSNLIEHTPPKVRKRSAGQQSHIDTNRSKRRRTNLPGSMIEVTPALQSFKADVEMGDGGESQDEDYEADSEDDSEKETRFRFRENPVKTRENPA